MPGADLAAVKAHLNEQTNANDARLQMYLNAITSVIEEEVGPLVIQSFSEDVSTRGSALVVTKRPIVSVTSIVPTISTWPSFAGTDVRFDAKAGSIWRLDYGSLAGTWVVTYTAGNAVVGDDVKLTQLLLVQDIWEATRGGTRKPGVGSIDPSDLGAGSELRRRVRVMLRASRLGGIGIG